MICDQRWWTCHNTILLWYHFSLGILCVTDHKYGYLKTWIFLSYFEGTSHMPIHSKSFTTLVRVLRVFYLVDPAKGTYCENTVNGPNAFEYIKEASSRSFDVSARYSVQINIFKYQIGSHNALRASSCCDKNQISTDVLPLPYRWIV